MKPLFKASGLFMIGVIGTLIVLEAILRLLPVNYPSGLTPGFGAGHAAMYVADSRFTYSRDWDLHLARHGRIGRVGFHGYCEPTPVQEQGLFITGDSYTEALMLPPELSIGGQLHRLRPDLGICVAGMSGASASEFLAQHDEMSRLGAAKVWVIVLNRYDFVESYSVRDGMAGFPAATEPTDREFVGRAYRRPALLEKSFISALARYLYYNLNAKGIVSRWRCSLRASFCDDSSALALTVSPDEVSAIERFFAGVARRAKASDQTVLLFITDVIGGKPNAWERADPFWSLIERKSAELGIATRRTSSIMNRDACVERGCYLFRDGHWSPEGHRAMAQSIARMLPATQQPGPHSLNNNPAAAPPRP